MKRFSRIVADQVLMAAAFDVPCWQILLQKSAMKAKGLART